MKARTLLIVAVAMLFLASGPAEAILVGDPATSTNCLPFSCPDTFSGEISRYQQVYSAGEFSSAIDITEIRFFRDFTNPTSDTLASGTFEISLSTTSVVVGALSTVFDSNLGADNQLFTTEVLAGGTAPSVLSFTGTPFLYNPNLGNLLLDIRISDYSLPGGIADYESQGGVNSFFSRAFDSADGGPVADAGGLVTEFLSVPIPEPSGVLLFGAGMLVVGRALRRRTA